MGNSSIIGAWGEVRAAEYLRKKRYRLLGRNYTVRGGEIDLIAEKGGFVVFAEVKLRKSADFAQAREFVDARKRERLTAAAQLWLAGNDCALQPRFDVIEVYAPRGADSETLRINHIENAF